MSQEPAPDYSLTLLKSIEPVIESLKLKFEMIDKTKTLNNSIVDSLECDVLATLHIFISLLDQIFILQQSCKMEADDDIQLKSHALRDSIIRKKTEFVNNLLEKGDIEKLKKIMGGQFAQFFKQQNK